MGLSGVSPLSLLLILLIVIVLFGSSKLKTLGKDLGDALRNFRESAARDDDRPS
ncbi:TatA protein(twin arginine translocation) [Legionella geestiana]|uniref:Sec-independent protein translocase protein TatA n=1 Tax=Legionella geestiana TaxID=45065 RepID=A0A0W0TNT7_9GAMM|nr:twin-arginine translocase TatA/TatE family subunit [Legionella geestiana]KTC97252.1 TatA protein(twin arginine translocation) [Legionella geestiana]QBS12384.1 twin-arginine translocase TatA/TatE family subunit [Legionella geestiana]QDQ39903.1 twin-arginine translocase TatA/TatE family subunit [Legionella geestiana]STX55177.1 TatA protein(twin arginine translocation) [Legionella geestiana]